MNHATPRTWILFLALGLILGTASLPGPARAAGDDASVGFYLTDARGSCGTLDPPGCGDDEIQLSGELFTPYYAVLCVFNALPDEGVAGLSCGIDYQGATGSGVDIADWTLCADGLYFPTGSGEWPKARTGVRITWVTCQQEVPGGSEGGVTAVAGFFYVTAYSNDRLQVTTNNDLDSGPELKVAKCPPEPREYSLPISQAGSVGFSDDGSETGTLDCQPLDVETTWGRIKDLYNNR